MRTILSAIMIIAISCGLSAQIVPSAGIVYVKQNGTGNGSSWASATADLQGAILTNGVTQVWVAAGTYFPTWQWNLSDPRAYSFRMKNGVAIYGGFPDVGNPTMADRNSTIYLSILSGDIGIASDLSDNSYHVVLNEDTMALDSTAQIIGMNITKGNANVVSGSNNRGGGVYNDECSPYFAECKLSSNYAVRGGGMYNLEASPKIYNCNFTVNHASETGGAILNSLNAAPGIYNSIFNDNDATTYGGAIANIDSCSPQIMNCRFQINQTDNYGGAIVNSNYSNPKIIQCRFENNSSGNYGGAILNTNSHPVLVNSLFVGNNSTNAGGALLNDAGSRPSIINCTIYNNTSAFGGGVANNSSTPYITNTIIWACGTSIGDVGSTPLVRYSCIQGGYSGLGNISTNPLLEGTSFTDFRPTINSPVINAGINDSVPAYITYDYDNFNRIVGSAVDMGVYESRGIIYVNWSAAGNNNGASWGNAFVSLDDAINAASEGNQIWVIEGTFVPSNTHGLGATNMYKHFPVKNGVKMYGGFSGWENFESERDLINNTTTLSGNLGAGQYAYHVLLVDAGADTSTLIDGFKITLGMGFGTGDFLLGSGLFVKNADVVVDNCLFYLGSAANGGNVALVNSNSIFTNCNFISGYAGYYGGAVLMNGGANQFEFCTFENNDADNTGGAAHAMGNADFSFYACHFNDNYANDGYGGAINNIDGQGSIISCYFDNNHATLGGGAIYSEDNLSIINCTFAANSHDINSAGGALYLGSSPTIDIYNCIFANTIPAAYACINKGIATVNISNSDIEDCGGSGGAWQSVFGNDLGGNIDQDPIFNLWMGIDGIDDASPCVNTGSLVPFTSGIAQGFLLDHSGSDRIRGISVDMGAFEVPFSKLKVNIEPAAAISAGAQWSCDNGFSWHNSGDSLWFTELTLNVEFKNVAGYITPNDSTISLMYGMNALVTGVYVEAVAMEDNLSASVFNAYPNPFSDIVYIQINCEDEVLPVNLFDSFGHLLMQFQVNENFSIDMNTYPAGYYYLRCKDHVFRLIKL